jgi:hypothetical protein
MVLGIERGTKAIESETIVGRRGEGNLMKVKLKISSKVHNRNRKEKEHHKDLV